MTDDSPPEEPVPPRAPGFPFRMDPRDRPRERFPEWVYWLPYLSVILLSLYRYYYERYAWVLLGAAIALLLINPRAALVFFVGWCVLTAAYVVAWGALRLVLRLIARLDARLFESARGRARHSGRRPPAS